MSMLAIAVCVAVAALAPATASAQPKRGIDVSRFQGEINWKRVGTTNVKFAWVQASRGDGSDCAVVPDRCGADEFYAANYEGATAAGNWDGQGWSVWQYTSSGRVKGIRGAVDRNRMRVGWRKVSVR
jgi:GH25 family lysozyme M1 (1,4-beta-N-acetylmuramidase)